MSRASVVAKRYAKALFEVAQQRNNVSEVEEQLKLVVSAAAANPDLSKFLSSPNIEGEKKAKVLKEALGAHVSADVIHTLEVLVLRGRHNEIEGVAEAYTKIAGEALGQANATVYTAKALSEAEAGNVAASFGALVGKKIRVEQVVKPELLGGVQVRIGDRLYDGSLAGKLARLEKSLKS